MNILGVYGFGMNPAACLIVDGVCAAFAEEERFTRFKVSEGLFPSRAAAFCLAHAKLSLSDIDRIAFGWDVRKYPWKMLGNFSGNFLKYGLRGVKRHPGAADSSWYSVMEGLTDFHAGRIRPGIVEGLRSAGFTGDIPPVEFVGHHLAHAYSAFCCSGFPRAGILTIDGHGEELCTQLAVGDAGGIRITDTYEMPHSLGWFYAAVTEYLGFIPYRDEGKLMGLAALGEARKGSNPWIEVLSRIIKTGNGTYSVDPRYTLLGSHYYGKRFTDALVELITAADPSAMPIAYGEKALINGKMQSKYLMDVYVDIAFAAQELLERAAVMLAKKLVVDHKVDDLCVAGGVGLNCKMNGEILRRSGCRNIYVQPAASDAGTALGAALFVAHRNGERSAMPLRDVYQGPGYSNDEILSALKNCKVPFVRLDDPAAEAARLLAQGNIVAWFQGRMEFGARALGNRSILANPVIPAMRDKVNNEVKYRESWRPFCPSMTDTAADRYIDGVNEASTMTVAYHMRDSQKVKLPSIVHVDGTIRPQVVSKQNNPLYYRLIETLGKQTGHPVVMNTSFNVRGEPIICSPLEAVRCFYSNGLDALIVGDYLLRKNNDR